MSYIDTTHTRQHPAADTRPKQEATANASRPSICECGHEKDRHFKDTWDPTTGGRIHCPYCWHAGEQCSGYKPPTAIDTFAVGERFTIETHKGCLYECQGFFQGRTHRWMLVRELKGQPNGSTMFSDVNLEDFARRGIIGRKG